MDNNIINLCHSSSSSFSSTDENENVKVASTTQISNTPSRMVKVEASISRSAPVAMGKYKSREIKRENYVNESTSKNCSVVMILIKCMNQGMESQQRSTKHSCQEKHPCQENLP